MSAQIRESEYDQLKENACRKFRGGVVSPDNPVEIETVEITKFISCGHNLFDPSQAIAGGTINGITLTNNGDGTFNLNGTATNTSVFLLYKVSKPGTYHFYGMEKYEEGLVRIDIRNSAQAVIGGAAIDTGDGAHATFTVTTEPLYLSIRTNTGYTVSNLAIKPMLYQEGSGEYEPFIGKSITTELSLYSLPDGTCDEVIDGRLIRRIKKLELDGSSDEFFNTQNPNNPYISYADGNNIYDPWTQHANAGPILCNRLKSIAPDALWIGSIQGISIESASASRIRFRINGITTVTDFRTWLQSHPLTIYVKLAKPQVTPISDLIIPTHAPYTIVSHDSPVATEIEYEILTKSDYVADIIDIKQRLAALEAAAIE